MKMTCSGKRWIQ